MSILYRVFKISACTAHNQIGTDMWRVSFTDINEAFRLTEADNKSYIKANCVCRVLPKEVEA